MKTVPQAFMPNSPETISPPITYLVGRGGERLAVSRWPALRFVTPWQPIGTLVRQVFQAARSVAEENAPMARRRWSVRTLDALHDLTRLRRAFRCARLSAAQWAAISPADIGLVRLGVEGILAVTLVMLPGDEKGRHGPRTRPRGRVTVHLHPLDIGWPMNYPLPVWEGIAGDVDLFRTTTLGATVLSASYGVARGTLRLCRTCRAFFIPAGGQWSRRLCDDCRGLRPSVGRTRGPLAAWKAARWSRVAGRMRKRGFARLGYTTETAQDAWRAEALAALHEAATVAEVNAWEERVAPRGRSGRPRKTGGSRGEREGT